MRDIMEELPKTRKTALAAGTKYYFTGEPCKHGHVTPRFSIDGACKGCRYERNLADLAAMRAWRRSVRMQETK